MRPVVLCVLRGIAGERTGESGILLMFNSVNVTRCDRKAGMLVIKEK